MGPGKGVHLQKVQTACQLAQLGRHSSTYHLDMSLDDTPKLAATNLDCISSSETTRLEVTAELVEHWLLEIAKDADSREEVVEV